MNFARRAPFTLLLLLLLLGVGLVTRAHLGPLSPKWLARLGFGSADLWLFEFDRLLTSAVSTHGGAVFWRALFAVALLVGAAEWRAGTQRAVIVFVATHLLSLLMLALFVSLGLRSWHPPLAELLHTARDVGPSAGYFGCFGLLCSTLPRAVRRLLGLGTAGVLGLLAAFALMRTGIPAAAISAALVHMLAFPVGWLLAFATRPSPRLPLTGGGSSGGATQKLG